MTDQVQEVKRKADIVGIVSERVKLQKAGRNWRGLCPFHSEKTPSFNVSPELQIFKCFGCNESGDVFTFLEKYEGMEFSEALQYVADRVGVKLAEYRVTPQSQKRDRSLEILNLAAEFYHYLLMEHKIGEVAREYLKGRGIWKQTMETWRLGYAPEGWDNLYKYLVKKKKYDPGDVETVGLITKNYDRFRGRIMFPLTNQRGQVLGFAGRLLDPPSLIASEGRGAKYINTSETELYHKSELLFGLSVAREEIKKADRVVVVEGEFDAITSWQYGVKNVVAIKGSAFTEEQIQLLSRYTRNMALSLDADLAGDTATRRSIALADRMGMNIRVVELVGGKDPDEIAKSDKDAWKSLVAKAVNAYDFYVHSALKRWDVKTGEGKREITRNLMPVLAQIANVVEQAHYTQKVARVLGVGEEVVMREMQRVAQGLPANQSSSRQSQDSGEASDGAALEEYVVGLLFQSEEALGELLSQVQLEWFTASGLRRLVTFLKEDTQFVVGMFVERLPDELKELAQRIWLKSGELAGVEVKKEFVSSVRMLKRKYMQHELSLMTGKIKELEVKKRKTAKEVDMLKKLREEFVVVSQREAW